MAHLQIAIVGGGIAGLSAASLLAGCGHRVTLFEKPTRNWAWAPISPWGTQYVSTQLCNAAAADIPAALAAYQRNRERQVRFYEQASRAMTLLANPDSRLARTVHRSVAGVLRRSAFARGPVPASPRLSLDEQL